MSDEEPAIVSLLKERIEEWHRYQEYIVIKLRDSPLDLLLFDELPLELGMGEVNWVLTGVKKNYSRKVSASLAWKGYLRRSAAFQGDAADLLNGNERIMRLVKLIEPVDVRVETRQWENQSDLNVSASIFHLPSPHDATFINGLVALIEEITEVLS